MPSRSKIAPELGKTAMQDSRVERREICSDMGIHAREPITNYLDGKGQNAVSPSHPLLLRLVIKLRTLNKTAPLPQEEHLTVNEYFRNQVLFPISMPHGKNSRQKSYFIPLPYITVFCPSPSFRNVVRPSISPASHKRARSHATWRNFPLHPQKGGSGRT